MTARSLVSTARTRGEVPQRPRLAHDAVARELVGVLGHHLAHLDHVVDVALRVRAPGNGKPHELHRGGSFGAVGLKAEHDAADLAAADTTGLVERNGQGLSGKQVRGDVGQERPGVEVDGVTTDGLNDGHACGEQRVAQVRRGADPVAQVVVLHDFFQSLRDRLQIAARRDLRTLGSPR